ncbi:MAG: DUF3572 domain-containing protein [Hyphomicrobiaceae bacterium]
MRTHPKPGRMTEEAALEVASQALLFLAEDAGRLGRFLAETGLDPDTLRHRARTPEVLGAALGHIMQDESTLLTFAANAGLKPEGLSTALAALGLAGPWDST